MTDEREREICLLSKKFITFSLKLETLSQCLQLNLLLLLKFQASSWLFRLVKVSLAWSFRLLKVQKKVKNLN